MPVFAPMRSSLKRLPFFLGACRRSFGSAPGTQLSLVRQILRPARIQAQLFTGQSDDQDERQADRVAAAIMRLPEPTIQPRPP
jgi:hypothetical protein